jgi:Histidine kinase-, DNA gyrase B-, and HSP90-like ATPase
MTDSFKPQIGKNVIETLTLGMYDDPRFIFREYVQNSADQIDIAVELGILEKRSQGIIDIVIDKEEKSIIIEDNATGIKSEQIRKFLGDVANSEKDLSKRKGFRGIGRLGGLGYCEKLVFETSYNGEAIKNIMTLNAKLLKDIINNRQDNSDASRVISIITDINTLPEKSESHYFKVSLFNITNDLILNKKAVLNYLSMVAPVAFSPDFYFKDEVKKRFREKNFELEEYNILLNSKSLYKAYSNYFVNKDLQKDSHLLNVSFFDVRDDNFQLLGLGWYGISDGLNKVLHEKNIVRGIRIRKNNITIGDESTLIKRFQTERTNLRYIGEVHVLGSGFIPNARRDYFNDNKTLEKFENELDKIFIDFEKRLPHIASDLHNRLKDILKFKELNKKYIADRQKFKTQPEQEQRYQEITYALKRAKSAIKIIDKIHDEAKKNRQIKDLFQSIISDNDYSVDDEIFELDSEGVYPPLIFSKLSIEQSLILNEVVVFLQDQLGHREAEPLIKKLQRKYN